MCTSCYLLTVVQVRYDVPEEVCGVGVGEGVDTFAYTINFCTKYAWVVRTVSKKHVSYLGAAESEKMPNQQMKERLKKEYTRRLRMILKSELNVKNKITAIGA